MANVLATLATAASVAFVGAGLALGGCATMVRGATESLEVNTRPPGATCTLSRNGRELATVHTTPGTTQITEGGDTILVVCRKEGYRDTIGVVASQFDGMTLGNILVGGLIGLAVDANTGAISDYSPAVTVTLIPKDFVSPESRDAFYDQMRTDYLAEWAKTNERVAKGCGEDSCKGQLEAAEGVKAAVLTEIERKRHLASIRQ